METRDKVLLFISDFRALHGVSPTVRTIGKGVGLRSTSVVHGHLQRLIKRGLLNVGWAVTLEGDLLVKALKNKKD